MTETTRRTALSCMMWAGTAALWTVSGGIPRAALIGRAEAATGFTFAQISDSHIGFSRDPNTDTPGTLKAAMDQVKALKPAMILHTGDVSHLSKPAEFDAAAQIVGAGGMDTHYVPGEHDVLDEDTKAFGPRFLAKEKPPSREALFYSFDQEGVHFIGLNNVTDLKAGGLGQLGEVQLAWLEGDLKGRSASQPIVVFAHIPLWLVYEQWGWGTSDGARALGLLARFGSVTVLNGHIHQVIQKVEGHVAFHTARSTAFPQPAPGSAPSPGPMKVDAGKLRSVLGVRQVSLVRNDAPLAVVDTPLLG